MANTVVKRLNHLLHEPLVHFLLIGAGLFLLFHFIDGPSDDNSDRIVVAPDQIKQMKAKFTRSWMRSPTTEELTGLINSYIRDEVYYREALAMGLDKDDALIRRRMRQKLEFILEDFSSQVDPTDEMLTAFMQKYEEKYRRDAKVSFHQVYLNPNKRPNLVNDARAILAQLSSGADHESLGDTILVGQNFDLASEFEIERVFGDSFTREILTLQPGDWAGPVRSGLGEHLVMVSERIGRRLPELAEVRAVVERDWLNERQKELKDDAFEKLLEGYEIMIEHPVESGVTSDVSLATTSPGTEVP